MGFLSGSTTFDCFRILDDDTAQFNDSHLEILQKFAVDESRKLGNDESRAGFLAGDHLFDLEFALEKNVIGEAMHCGIRIDTNQVPAAVKAAWLRIELANITAENPDRRPSKAEKEEAKEAVEARCEEAAKGGQFRKMSQFQVLWDAREQLMLVGSSSTTAIAAFTELFERSFNLEFRRLTAGRRAQEWATAVRRKTAMQQVSPSPLGEDGSTEIAWWTGEAENYDFLGNEFLLWLWWYFESESDTIELGDESEVTGMFARTLSLECAQGEWGKGTLSAEDPTYLPEAALAIRSGKLPRKAGLRLVRHDVHYELTLQAEMFSIGSAKIHIEDTGEGRGAVEDRVEAIRDLNDTVTLLFEAFCSRRIDDDWGNELEAMQKWLKSKSRRAR